jgi:hypothetical protein
MFFCCLVFSLFICLSAQALEIKWHSVYALYQQWTALQRQTNDQPLKLTILANQTVTLTKQYRLIAEHDKSLTITFGGRFTMLVDQEAENFFKGDLAA